MFSQSIQHRRAALRIFLTQNTLSRAIHDFFTHALPYSSFNRAFVELTAAAAVARDKNKINNPQEERAVKRKKNY
jgi:hypothetical protein